MTTTDPPAAPFPDSLPDPFPGRHPGLGTDSRLWLLRHAQVDEAWRGIAYGNLDVPLSDAGREATAALGEAFGALGPARLLSSPLQRARELGDAIAARAGRELAVDERLREIDRGAWHGRRVAELDEADIEAFYADPWTWRGHGGESDADVLARAWPVVEEALADAAPGAVAVLVAHYNVIRVLVGRALGISPECSFSLRIDPGHGVCLVDALADPARRIMAPGWILAHSNARGPL